jgi:hypothetical protein
MKIADGIFDLTREEYIAVLQNEVETLRRYYFKPQEEGTGHYNTAISVLESRIEELRND